ncbi:hypothetical protein KIN20_026115 [Parelaphostrongylus tenuis]|uniref:Uncharacterized protein n=1 Tax=Parelaphostrongylus tenuis TaxID=148309 RepID=A0AAD5NB77_PARTN|nr:hypothetical protein KIN20_026115 [Parelaphostrongylus tenuis]
MRNFEKTTGRMIRLHCEILNGTYDALRVVWAKNPIEQHGDEEANLKVDRVPRQSKLELTEDRGEYHHLQFGTLCSLYFLRANNEVISDADHQDVKRWFDTCQHPVTIHMGTF